MQTEILFELYRAQLAVGGVKKHRLPKSLHIPRPKPEPVASHANGSRSTRPGRRHATTPAEVLAVLQKGFG